MSRKFDIKKKILLAVIVCGSCFFCVGTGQNDDTNSVEPVSRYEHFQGKIYDEKRLEPVDMTNLIEQWQGMTKNDKSILSQKPGWRYVIKGGLHGFRYYISQDDFVLGWQYLERDGFPDWYYFDENTGLLVTDTILDGVVLAKQGFATAVSAMSEETMNQVNNVAHCDQVLVADDIQTENTISLTKEVQLVSFENSNVSIRRNIYQKKDMPKRQLSSVLEVSQQGNVTLGSGIKVLAGTNVDAGIVVKDSTSLSCYGFVGNDKGETPRYAIAALDNKTEVIIYPDAEISGADTGIYSEGETILVSEENEMQQEAGFLRGTVYAATVSSGRTISGNTNHGITQNGGTLTMSGGTIFNNGTLGSSSKTGSTGGGVYLKNKAIMNMSGGTISGNRASYGGGIYVSSGCKLNITGGTIGGTKLYQSKDENTTANGNYAREHKRSGSGTKYARGSGGGIYSEGNVYINGKNSVNISFNASKGPGGGGGILIYAGTTTITGNVNVNNNKALHSDGTSSAQVASGDPNAEGAGIRVGYDAVKDGAKCFINCSDSAGNPVTTGTVNIKGNDASGDGGGIYVSTGDNISLIIKGRTYIQKNISRESGGGGVKTLGGDISIYDADISGNTAQAGKGGGVHSAGEAYLSGCKIYGNTAQQEGGGVSFYTSTVGTTGKGIITACEIYENRSKSGAAGIEVRDEATAQIKGSTKVYNNAAGCSGIRVTQKAVLSLEECYAYGNGTYGVYNMGKTSVNGVTRIGYARYISEDDYEISPNQSGGIYNSGTFTVKDNKKLSVYGGNVRGLYNTGTVIFQNTSKSDFIGRGASEIIKNKGTITAMGPASGNVPIVLITGTNIKNGIDNDGGTLKWSGKISGNLKVGILNQNQGETVTYEASRIEACVIGVYNKVMSTTKAAGTYEATEFGIVNDGELFIGTVGDMKVSLAENTGIYNNGNLHGDGDSTDHCLFTGPGEGIVNAGVCNVGKAIKIESAIIEDRTGIVNEKGGQLYMTGGTYCNSGQYGVYCKSGSSFYMGKTARLDESNAVFLEPGCYIDVNHPLTQQGLIAKVDTERMKDRNPGRVVVRTSYVGGTGKKELYSDDGTQRFVLDYSSVDSGDPAFLADGSRINTENDVDITEKDIYVSTYYEIIYDSGYRDITGATKDDIAMKQEDFRKYWMEDIVLDLQPPAILSPTLISAGWKYLYWEGNNSKIYSLPKELFTDNRSLVLTARWKQKKESALDAWLYDRSAWLRNQMSGSKSDEQYKYFMAGDTGIITFSSVNLEDVHIVWPSTGSVDELRTYDLNGQNVQDKSYHIVSLTENISERYENSSYQFQVPVGTPSGVYYVTVIGQDANEQRWTCTLSLIVGDKAISSTIRTRIR